MRVLDLFSGIGGFSLGLERAGMRTVAFCEIEPYCRAVIARRWPGVPIFGDIRYVVADPSRHVCTEFPPSWPERERIGPCSEPIDVICGGFPCQDISIAGKGAGLAGARSGLWREYLRLIRELYPSWVIVENVSALLSRGLGEVLGDLAKIGYDAEWHCIPASYVGAPHRRDRIWIVAYPSGSGRQQVTGGSYADESQHEGRPETQADEPAGCREGSRAWDMGDTYREGLAQREARPREAGSPDGGFSRHLSTISDQWSVEPDVGRVAHGVPSRVDRLRALGNAVVPQVVEVIGRAIMEAERVRAAV